MKVSKQGFKYAKQILEALGAASLIVFGVLAAFGQTYTPNLNLAKPYAGQLNWTAFMNGNMDSIDSWAASRQPKMLFGSGAPSSTPLCSATQNPGAYYADTATWKMYFCDGISAWHQITSSQVYPPAGIPVSTGSGYGSSKAAPTGALVGDTDTQTLINKTVDGVTPATHAFLDPTSSVQTQLNAKAPVASPSFTGTPLTPTHGSCVSDTQIANGAYVAACAGGGGVQYQASNTNYVIWADSRGVVSDTCYMSNAPSDGVTITSGSISGGVLTAVTSTNYYASPTTITLAGFSGSALGLNGQIVNLITMSSTGFTANVTGITTLGSTGTGFAACAYNLSGNMRRDQYFSGHGTVINMTTAALDTPAALSQYTAQIHPLSPVITGHAGFLILQVGTQNWIEAGWSLSNAESDITSLLNAAKTDGYTVIMTTQIPHASNIYSPALSQLQLLQAWTRGMGPTKSNVAAGSYWDYLVDMALYLPDPTDAKFFIQSGSEAGHLTDMGTKVFADALNAALSLQTSLPVAPPLAAPAQFPSSAGIVANTDNTTSHNATAADLSAPLLCADTSGSGTAQVCNTAGGATPTAGTAIYYTTTTANTGTGLTINVNSLGAKSVAKWQGSTTLVANDLRSSKRTLMIYDGTNWEMSTVGNDPASSSGMPAPIFGSGDPFGLSAPTVANHVAGGNTFSATSGNRVVVIYRNWDAHDTTTPTVTDTLGTSFSSMTTFDADGTVGHIKVFSGVLSSSGTDAASLSGAPSHSSYLVFEGHQLSGTLDGSWVSTSSASPSITTTQADDLVVSLYGNGGSACPTVSGGWTLDCYRDNGWVTLADATQAAGAAGAYSPTWSGAGDWNQTIFAIKAAATPVAGIEGQLYFDAATTPYTKYIYHSSNWHLL